MSEKRAFLTKGDDWYMHQKKKMITANAMISLTAMMFLVLFLFQVSASSVEFFQGEKYQQIVDEDRLTLKNETKEDNKLLIKNKKKSYLFGMGNEKIPNGVIEGLTALKEPYEIIVSLEQVLENIQQTERIILYQTKYSDTEIQDLEKIASKGIDLIFAVLPEDLSQITLLEILGIDGIKKYNVKTDGIRVLEDYMLGGRSDYKKLSVHNIPWVQLKGSTKTYMCGLFKDYEKDKIKNEELPPLAWRNHFASSYVFVFNGNYMIEKSNMGMFISALANMKDTFVYPVINARAMFVNNFPFLTSENDKEMQKRYSMSTRRFLEDNILPDLVSITEKTGDVISAGANLSFDRKKETGEENQEDTLKSFQNILLKQNGEMGLSFYDRQDIRGKINSNIEFFQNNSKVKFPFFYGQGLSKEELLEIKTKIPEAGTVINEWDEIEGSTFQFIENDLVSVPVTSSDYAYSDKENLRLKNAMSGLGFSNHKIDIEDVVYPTKNKDNWRYQSVELGKNLDTFWKPYEVFDGLSLAEAGIRVRQYLLMDYFYEVSYSGKEVELQIENFHNEAYFLLRTNKELLHIEGGSWKEAGEGAYLLTIEHEKAKLTFKNVSGRR